MKKLEAELREYDVQIRKQISDSVMQKKSQTICVRMSLHT